MKFKSVIIDILIVIVITYVLFGLFLFLNQKSILYHPNNQNFDECNGFSDYQKINSGGTRFYYKQSSTNKVIVYYHGNAGSACDRSNLKSFFEQFNASLIFVEYAGYSNDKAKPSQDLILKDVKNIHDYINNSSYTNVLVYGQSIGSAAASYHAFLGNVNYLILVTSFSKLDDVAQSKYVFYPAYILLKEKFNNIKWLRNYEENLIILHGDRDFVIPHKFSQKLFQEIPSINKEYFLIEGKGHNDIWSSSIFRNKINEYINVTWN